MQEKYLKGVYETGLRTVQVYTTAMDLLIQAKVRHYQLWACVSECG